MYIGTSLALSTTKNLSHTIYLFRTNIFFIHGGGRWGRGVDASCLGVSFLFSIDIVFSS